MDWAFRFLALVGGVFPLGLSAWALLLAPTGDRAVYHQLGRRRIAPGGAREQGFEAVLRTIHKLAKTLFTEDDARGNADRAQGAVMLLPRLIALAPLLAAPALAIEGRYRIEGTNPGSAAVYRGEAVVKRTGETYTVGWQIGAARQVGTGVRTGDVLSIVYQTVGTTSFGVASFGIAGERVNGGAWTTLGAQRTGVEHWTPIFAE